MSDKYILDRLKACLEKVHGSFEKREEMALALFNAGYKGMKLDLESDIQFLKHKREGWIKAGHPGFLGLFGRDSLITAWQLLDYDPLIARNTLVKLTSRQGIGKNEETGEEKGKILHEYYPLSKLKPSDEEFIEEKKYAAWFEKHKGDIDWLKRGVPVYYSIDSTLLFLIVFGKYYEKTRDEKLRDILKDALYKAWMWRNLQSSAPEKNERHYDFVRYTGSLKNIANQGWKDSESYFIKPPVALVEIQGYAYAAGSSFRRYKKESEFPLLNANMGWMRQDFNEQFWMYDEQYYAFALDGDNEQMKDITSNPGHLLFTGIIDDEKKEKAVVRKLFSEELWTPYGIRTHSILNENYDPFSYHLGSVWPHDNWIIAQGLKACGYVKEYQMVKDALFKAYNDLGYIPEYYGVINDRIVKLLACYPQAWASGALLNFLMEE